jgi:hypothetical protein
MTTFKVSYNTATTNSLQYIFVKAEEIEKEFIEAMITAYRKSLTQIQIPSGSIPVRKPGGQLIGIHADIVNRMLDEQERQGNPRDISIFEHSICATRTERDLIGGAVLLK